MKMKDKHAEQKKKKEQHRNQLKASKRRKQPLLERQKPHRLEKEVILIVCEGEVTEPSYFRKFRLSSATIKAVGEGYNTITLVDRAVELSQRGDYDQVWCVFDKDDFPLQDFNNAITKAAANGVKVAYSNQAFEYWLLLHFEDHQGGAMHRDLCCEKLDAYLKNFGLHYDLDKKIITEEIFEVLINNQKARQNLAKERAKRNYDLFDHSSPALEESSTTVFKLVEEIEKFL